MDTVDSVGAYWSFYSVWNSLNVLLMTQSDAPNEGRENKTAVDFLIEFSPTPKAGYEDTWILRSMEAYKRQETESLRDQLSKERELTKVLTQEVADLRVSNSLLIDNENKEREMRKELVGLIEDMRLNYTESNFEDYNYKINSLLEKASELDKNKET